MILLSHDNDFVIPRLDNRHWLVNPAIGRPVASALIDGALHRETSNWNHKADDCAFLELATDPAETWLQITRNN